MAKKKDDDEKLLKEIASQTEGALLGDREDIKYFIDTGNLALNYMCSGKFIDGGIPGGKLTECFGPSSSGKSLLATNILRGCQKMGGLSGILDCENATDVEFMERAGKLDCNKVLRYCPPTIKRCFSIMCAAISKIREHKPMSVPIAFVYDSIGVSPSEREYAEIGDKPADMTPADWRKLQKRKEQPGERAKEAGAGLRKINAIIDKCNATVFIINQIRDMVGVLYGSPETTAGGGKALPFYASCRLRIQTQKNIVHASHGAIVGVNLKIKNKKNRAFRPFIEIEGVKLYFDSGIDPLSGLLKLLVQEGRILDLKRNSYQVATDYLPEDKSEYKFKVGSEDNSVPMQVVLDCPKIINCQSQEEVENYLSQFSAALATSASGNFIEKSVHANVDEMLDEEIEEIEENDEE